MNLTLFGLNHQTTPIDLRERVVFRDGDLIEHLQALRQFSNCTEVLLLSTCNRTEIYCISETPPNIPEWIAQIKHLPPALIAEHGYYYQDLKAVHHLLRVATGIDSLVIGESQILGQLKKAYQFADEANTLGPELHRLFQFTFSIGKKIRTQTAIGTFPVSVASLAITLAKRIFENIANTRTFFIGAGDTIERAANAMQQAGAKHFYFVNRSAIKAYRLAKQFNGTSYDFTALIPEIKNADIIISATSSMIPILGKGAIEKASKARKHRPMLILDLALPRDVEPEVGHLSDVFLYNIDDLKQIAELHQQERREAAQDAESLITLETAHYANLLRERTAIPTIRRIRERVKSVHDQAFSQACKALQQGVPAEVVLQDFARRFSNRLLHQPFLRLKQASYDGDTDILQAAQDLLALD